MKSDSYHVEYSVIKKSIHDIRGFYP